MGNEWHWWLETRWLKHRNAVKYVHSLLAELDATRGHTWMTTDHVVAVLDALDPAALAGRWLASRRNHQHSRRRCAYQQCSEQVRSVNAKYCEMHAEFRKREAHRKAQKKYQSQTDKSDFSNPASGAEFVKRSDRGT